MNEDALRKEIRLILNESETLSVKWAKKTGIDHREGYVIYLSDGREDYAPLQGFILKGSAPAMYGCKLITGILIGRLDGGKYSYEFDGIDCEEYVEIDVKTIKLANQIS
jgi:hypothetical protein